MPKSNIYYLKEEKKKKKEEFTLKIKALKVKPLNSTRKNIEAKAKELMRPKQINDDIPNNR